MRPTFSDAADEAGISRRYGGIHFEDGDLRGREMGRQSVRRLGTKRKTTLLGRVPNVHTREKANSS